MIIINGEQSDSIHVMDRGMMYGDGVFRTMRMQQRKIQWWPLQYRKLRGDCDALEILCPPQAVLEAEIAQLAEQESDCVVKIIISRGEGGRGYRVPDSVSPNRVILTAPLPNYPNAFWTDGVALHLCEMRLCHQPRLAGIKHLNRLENVLARMEWEDAAIPEGLMLDVDAWVIAGTMSNIFIRRDVRLLTPDLSACGVAGLQRERILGYGAQLGLKAEVTQIGLSDLLSADEVFVCNSVVGVWPVNQVGSHQIRRGTSAAQLQRLLAQEAY